MYSLFSKRWLQHLVFIHAQELGCENTLQVDFWEAMLMASSQNAIIQELLFRLASVYIDRLTFSESPTKHKSLKSADDLVRLHSRLYFFWAT